MEGIAMEDDMMTTLERARELRGQHCEAESCEHAYVKKNGQLTCEAEQNERSCGIWELCEKVARLEKEKARLDRALGRKVELKVDEAFARLSKHVYIIEKNVMDPDHGVDQYLVEAFLEENLARERQQALQETGGWYSVKKVKLVIDEGTSPPAINWNAIKKDVQDDIKQYKDPPPRAPGHDLYGAPPRGKGNGKEGRLTDAEYHILNRMDLDPGNDEEGNDDE